MPKKIKIYNNKEKEIEFKPMDMRKYLLKLKKNKKIKPLLLKKQTDLIEGSMEQKLALDKLSQLINECDEKSENEGNEINKKIEIGKLRKPMDANNENLNNSSSNNILSDKNEDADKNRKFKKKNI